MARIRTIKPEFWTSEQVVECSPITRLLFVGLWNFCDKKGRHSFSPKQIKGQVFPSDDISIDKITEMLWELSDNGLIVIYDNENKRFLEVTGWRHQKIDNESDSKIPGSDCEDSEIFLRRADDQPPNDRLSFGLDSSKDLGLRNQDLGKEKKTNKKKESSDSIEKQFLDFWERSPNKVGKAAARKAFEVALRRTSLAEILAGLERYIRDKPPDRSWCNPSTWLNQDRWLDQPAQAAASHSTESNGNGAARKKPLPTASPGQDRLRTETGLWIGKKFYSSMEYDT